MLMNTHIFPEKLLFLFLKENLFCFIELSNTMENTHQNNAHKGIFSALILARILLLMFVVIQGLEVMIYYQPTTDVDSSGEAQEIPNWLERVTLLSMMAISIPLFLGYRMAALSWHKSLVLSWFVYPELIVFGLQAITAAVLNANKKSSAAHYIDTWPSVVFTASMCSSIILFAGLFKYPNAGEFYKALLAVGLKDNPNVSNSVNSAPLLESSESQDDSSNNKPLDSTTEALSNLANRRFIFTGFSLIWLGVYSSQYGILTDETVKESHLFWYVIPSMIWLIFFMGCHLCSSPIHWAKHPKMLVPEMVCFVMLAVNFFLMLANSAYVEHNHWSGFAIASQAVNIIMNGIWTIRYRHTGDITLRLAPEDQK